MADITDIAKFDEETERTIKWSLYYYEKWNELPNQQQQSALEKVYTHKDIQALNELLETEESYKKALETAGKQAANKFILDRLNRLVAQEVVKASLGGVKTEAGRRGAVFIAEESARLAAARGANVAISGVTVLASLPVGITAAVGEMVGDAIASQAGITNPHVKNAFGLGGSMSGGAAAGAIVGGPIGALAGAAVGAGSWAVGKSITAFLNTAKGPSDNTVSIKIGDIGNDELCVGTYEGKDTVYLKTYWKEDKKSNAEWEMSAGQPQNKAFQLCIWHKNRVIKHFNEVYYRDMVVIIKNESTFRVAHCKGQQHPSDSGKVFIFE